LLVSLKDAGVGAISLGNATTIFNMTESDNSLQGQLKSTGVFLFENGNVGSIHQVDLADRSIEEAQTPAPQLFADQTVNISENDLQIPQEISNPLQDLIDRVEKLKQEMKYLLEKRNPVFNQEKFNSSKSNQYFDLNSDPSNLLFNYRGFLQHSARYA